MVSSYNLRSRGRKQDVATSTRSYIVNGLPCKIPNVILQRGWNPCSLLTAHFRETEFEVKQSTIVAAGLGVYTKRNITAGKRVLEYKGQFLQENQNRSFHNNINTCTRNSEENKKTITTSENDSESDKSDSASASADASEESNDDTGNDETHGQHKYCFELVLGDPVCLCAIMPSEILSCNDDFLRPENVSIAGRINDLDYDFKRKRYRPKQSRKNNLEWEITDTQQVFLVSTRSIKKGEELGVDYGSGYWKRK